jgi:hypothetical protein
MIGAHKGDGHGQQNQRKPQENHLLRTQMLEAEATIRGQIGRDEDCSENALALMAMRAEMSMLSKERARLGDDKEPILVERLMHQLRPPAVKPMAPELKRRLAAKRA